MNQKALLDKERKLTDAANAKLIEHQKCESVIYRKKITINELRAKLQNMEIEQTHQLKQLTIKRNQIEEEKIILRQNQVHRNRSITKQNLSATRA